MNLALPAGAVGPTLYVSTGEGSGPDSRSCGDQRLPTLYSGGHPVSYGRAPPEIAALPLPQLRPYIQRTDPSPLVKLHHRGQWQAFDEVLNVRVSPATPGTCQ